MRFESQNIAKVFHSKFYTQHAVHYSRALWNVHKNCIKNEILKYCIKTQTTCAFMIKGEKVEIIATSLMMTTPSEKLV